MLLFYYMSIPDQLPGTSKTIFEASFSEIFWRNFVAGMARTLGGLVLYAVVLFLLGTLFVNQVWPALEPQFEAFAKVMTVLQDLNVPKSPFGR
jgi:hypothetical protein